MSDLYVNETLLNVPFDGVAGSTVYTDYSYHKIKAVPGASGSVQLTTANPKYAGHASVLFSGVANSAIAWNGLNINTGWYGTVEFDVYFNAVGKAHGLFSVLGLSGAQLYMDLLATNHWQFGTASGSPTVSTGAVAAAATWYSAALCCAQSTPGATTGTITLYIGGAQMAQALLVGGVAPFGNVTGFDLGTDLQSTATWLDAQVANLRVTPGVCRYSAPYTPPSAPFDQTLPGLVTTGPIPVIHYSVPNGVMPAVVGKYVQLVGRVADVQHGGTGKISGTTSTKNTPTNTPVGALVRLYSESDGGLIASQYSNSTTGAYQFSNVDTTKKYTVITYDATHTFRAVIADNLTPDPMP